MSDWQKVRSAVNLPHIRFLARPVVELRKADLLKAAELPFDDYEDAIQSICAARTRADYIVTRNEKDFANSSVSAISPVILLMRL